MRETARMARAPLEIHWRYENLRRMRGGWIFFEDMLEICRRYVEEYTIHYRKYFEDMLEIR